MRADNRDEPRKVFDEFCRRFRKDIENIGRAARLPTDNDIHKEVIQIFWEEILDAITTGHPPAKAREYERIMRESLETGQLSKKDEAYIRTTLRRILIDVLRSERGRPRGAQGDDGHRRTFEPLDEGLLASKGPPVEEQVERENRWDASRWALNSLLKMMRQVVDDNKHCSQVEYSEPKSPSVAYKDICRDPDPSAQCPGPGYGYDNSSRERLVRCTAGGLIPHPFHVALLEVALAEEGLPNVRKVWASQEQFKKDIKSAHYEWDLTLGCLRRLTFAFFRGQLRQKAG